MGDNLPRPFYANQNYLAGREQIKISDLTPEIFVLATMNSLNVFNIFNNYNIFNNFNIHSAHLSHLQQIHMPRVPNRFTSDDDNLVAHFDNLAFFQFYH